MYLTTRSGDGGGTAYNVGIGRAGWGLGTIGTGRLQKGGAERSPIEAPQLPPLGRATGRRNH